MDARRVSRVARSAISAFSYNGAQRRHCTSTHERTHMRAKHTELFMIRHGETDSNASGIFHGSTDVPLNARGLRQASLVAERLQRVELLHSLHSSPLQRALVTARAI